MTIKAGAPMRALRQAGGNAVAGQEARKAACYHQQPTLTPTPSSILTHSSCLAIKDIYIMMPMPVPNVCFRVRRGL